jgi:hypothetical protein
MEGAKECWPAIWSIPYTNLSMGVSLGRAYCVLDWLPRSGGRELPNSKRMSQSGIFPALAVFQIRRCL